MLKNIKSVIFDLDGTLIDSMHVWDQVDIDFLAKRGIEIPPYLFENLPAGDGLLAIAIYFKKRFNLPESPEKIISEWNSMVLDFYSKLPLINGAKSLLKKLTDKNYTLGIGTSNSLVLTEASLKYNQISHFFGCVVTGCKIKKGKPFPDIYLQAAELLNSEPNECLVIEDTLHGVESAKNAGMSVIGIYNEYSKKDMDKIKLIADAYVNNYKELDSLLF